MDDESDDPKTPPRAQKKMKYTQKYSKNWESLPLFKGWLKPSEKSKSRAFCKACDCELNAKKSELEKHAGGLKHKNNVAGVSRQPTLLSMPSFSGISSREKDVKEGEVKLAAFVVEHNLPMNVMTHLPGLIKSICKDSEIAKQFASSRTKTTAVIKNVIGKTAKEELVEVMRKNKFSLIVDESTDKGCIKHLCILARIVMSDKVTEAFFDLIPIQDATGQSLYDHIVKAFADENIPYKENMIGFASDGASAMMGIHNSLSSRLKNDIPDLFVFKCICHSFHLCSSYACNTLPRSVEQLARDVYNYFMSSPKRLSELKEFQHFVQVKPHKLLHPSQTRWLSLEAVVSRLLEQYDALKLYFTNAVLGDRVLAGESILEKLNNPVSKLYLQFLEFVLPFFNDLNKKMQSEGPQIHLMYDTVSSVCKTFMECYLKESYVKKTDVQDVQYKDPRNFVPLNKIYLGAKVVAAIANDTHGLSERDLDAFRQRCLNFLIESVTQISVRFPFRSPILKQMYVIDPSSILKKTVPSIAPLVSLFPNLIKPNEMNQIDGEWRILRNTELQVPSGINVEDFWQHVSKIKAGDDNPRFPLLSYFVSCLLILPHSSAAAERIFSAVNIMKTKQRNRLSTKTLIGLLHSKRYLRKETCSSFNPNINLLKRMTADIYKDESDSE